MRVELPGFSGFLVYQYLFLTSKTSQAGESILYVEPFPSPGIELADPKAEPGGPQ